MKLALALVAIALGCSGERLLLDDTWGTRRALDRIEHARYSLDLDRQFHPLRIDFTEMLREAFKLDAYGQPDTRYPSFSTRLAPTPGWKKHIQHLCRARGGESYSYRGGRFEPFRCYGEPLCDESGCMEGELLFEVSFVK